MMKRRKKCNIILLTTFILFILFCKLHLHQYIICTSLSHSGLLTNFYLGTLNHLEDTTKITFEYLNDQKLFSSSRMVEGIVNSNDFTKVSSTTQPIFIIFIKSGVERFDHRKSIRNSWLSKKSIKFLKNYEIFHRFVIGQSKNQTIIKKVFEENKNHSDIVIGDFEDNYYNNTAKATLAFRLFCDVVKRRFGNSLITNLIIIDDDYWLNLKNLERFLIENKQNSLPQKLLLFSGYTFDDSLPRRSILDKWTIDTSKYPFCSYPIYVSAGIMILSRDIALRINLIERFVTFRKFDDIFFGIIASLLKIDLTTTNNEYFITFNYRSSTKLTRDKAISIHGIEEKALERKWKRYCQLHCRK